MRLEHISSRDRHIAITITSRRAGIAVARGDERAAGGGLAAESGVHKVTQPLAPGVGSGVNMLMAGGEKLPLMDQSQPGLGGRESRAGNITTTFHIIISILSRPRRKRVRHLHSNQQQ
jgi:hypothetical protein